MKAGFWINEDRAGVGLDRWAVWVMGQVVGLELWVRWWVWGCGVEIGGFLSII